MMSGDAPRHTNEISSKKSAIFFFEILTLVGNFRDSSYWQEVHKTSYIFEDNPFFEFFYFFILFLSQTVSRKVHLESNICCIILI